ncbi:MAG: winged helix-turn-helix domain-containing protein [Lysobacterales bacterium]
MASGYCLGEWTVRPHRNQIERGGQIVHLAPKAMAVLNCLAEAANSVVERQKIFDSVWPGAAISDEALTQQIADLRRAFGDSAQHATIIETIPKVGFRLIPPITPLPEETATPAAPGRTFSNRKRLKWIALPVIALLVAWLSLSRFLSVDTEIQKPSANAEQPVVAVLPFVNMSGNPNDEYFADGISEELINLLANVPGLDAISRTSSFSFKGESMKIADIARELNASLIVEGTVRKNEKQVRITAQLIDPVTDRHLWSASYDRELSDIFPLQEEIAQSIVTALQDKIGAQTVAGPRPTESIEAYELFLSGRHYFYQRGAALDKSIMLFRMAVDKDPNFAEAWAYLAAAGTVTGFYRTAISDEDALAICLQASRKALALDPDSGLALAVQAMAEYGAERNITKGFELIDRAVKAAPEDTTVRLWAGMYYWYWGYLEEAHLHFDFVYRHDPRVGISNGSLGLLYLAQGREDLAAPLLARATELDYPNHHHAQASLLMKRGDFDAAFARLKITLVDPGSDYDRLAWVYELEEAGRSYVENPVSADALLSVINRAPGRGAIEKARLALLFDLKDAFFEFFPLAVKQGPFWLAYLVPTLWLPEYRDYIEDPRYLEVMRRDGALEMWEQRGYLDGCIRVDSPAGDRLDCSNR